MPVRSSRRHCNAYWTSSFSSTAELSELHGLVRSGGPGQEPAGELVYVGTPIGAPGPLVGSAKRAGAVRPQLAVRDEAARSRHWLPDRGGRGEPGLQVRTTGAVPALEVGRAQAAPGDAVTAIRDLAASVRPLPLPSRVGRSGEGIQRRPPVLLPALVVRRAQPPAARRAQATLGQAFTTPENGVRRGEDEHIGPEL